jgi:hypothetical protein
MKIQNLMERAKSKTPQASIEKSSGNDVMWYVIESRVLDGEKILLVTEKKYLKEARKEHPDKVIYFPPEIRELAKHEGSVWFKDMVKKVHMAKKEFKGWIVPSDKKGGIEHAERIA